LALTVLDTGTPIKRIFPGKLMAHEYPTTQQSGLFQQAFHPNRPKKARALSLPNALSFS
jgi:hypothetical protein